MISNAIEYQKATEELKYLEAWLARLQVEHTGPAHGLTKAGIRKMISRLHEELGCYEGELAVDQGRRE